jgi:phosphohistidine phosphatase SixA
MRLLTLILALLMPAIAAADPLAGWRTPGVIALMRHATAPGTGDPSGFRLDACETQRNLSQAGRAEARAIGAGLRAANISFDAVWTSQWCRCRDTATELGLGPEVDVPALGSFFDDRSTAGAQTAETLALLAANAGKRLLLVTHQVNITALTGVVPRSGEIVLTRMVGGRLEVIDRLPPP